MSADNAPAPRYIVATWHGEHASRFYLVDTVAPEDEQPAVLATYTSRKEAQRWAEFLNFDTARGSGAKKGVQS